MSQIDEWVGNSALRSARLPVNLIGSTINYANRSIGSPITSQSAGSAGPAEQRVLHEVADLRARLGGSATALSSPGSPDMAALEVSDQRLGALQAEAALLRQSPTGEAGGALTRARGSRPRRAVFCEMIEEPIKRLA